MLTAPCCFFNLQTMSSFANGKSSTTKQTDIFGRFQHKHNPLAINLIIRGGGFGKNNQECKCKDFGIYFLMPNNLLFETCFKLNVLLRHLKFEVKFNRFLVSSPLNRKDRCYNLNRHKIYLVQFSVLHFLTFITLNILDSNHNSSTKTVVK